MDDTASPPRRAVGRRRGQFAGPITTFGAAVLALGITAYLVGWRLGWIELMVLAAGCAVAVLLAIPFLFGRSTLTVERVITEDRIEVGGELDIGLLVTNTSTSRTRPIRLDELAGADGDGGDGDGNGRHAGDRSVLVPALAAGATHEHRYVLAPPRRCRLVVGPAVLSRADPLRLVRRDIAQGPASVCWVYPRMRLLAPLPVGYAKDLEGPTSDTSPVGDVAFHAIRPYTTGDDRRHIHWMSTARTGELMVRHYVDNRRPHLAVALDDNTNAWAPEQFEVGVSIAASLTSSTLRRQLPLSLRFGATTVVGDTTPGTLDSCLEHLTLADTVERRPDDLVLDASAFLRAEHGVSALVVITGSRSPEDLMRLAIGLRRRTRVILAIVGSRPVSIPGTLTICVEDLDQFAAGWAARTR